MRTCLLGFAFVLGVVISGFGQLAQLSNVTSTPLPGSGHDYIQMLNETVNPASGSLSVRIDVPMPKGRGLTLPFSFDYDSNGVWYLNSSDNGQSGWVSSTTLVSSGGWGYSVPLLAASMLSVSSDNGGGTCNFVDNFIFQDPSGGRHSLGIASTDGQLGCPDAPVTFAGDDFYRASTGTNSALPRPTWVADTSGTTFYFSMSNPETIGVTEDALADYVEDTNGNRINISRSGSSFNYTDTLGRTVLSYANNSLTVSGLSNPYTIGRGTASANYSVDPIQTGTFSCSGPGTVTGSLSVITSITLPNNKSFTFQYDAVYGLLTKIIYPTGGYVRYVWGLNDQSESGQWPYQDSFGNWNVCQYRYGAPAVQHRYVSFDGVTEVLQQDFTYSTSWPGSSLDWNNKYTTVTTHDLVRGVAFDTSYTYAPSTCGPPPVNTQSQFSSQCAVEQTVVYKNFDGTTAKTSNKTWYDASMLQTDQTVLETNQISQTTYAYANNNKTAVISEKDEYDYGQGTPGALIRKTVTNYVAFPTTPIFTAGASILGKPCQTLISDGVHNPVAESDYFYDGGTSVCGSPGTPSVSDVPGGLPSGTHDETNYGVGSTAPRGNLTKMTRKCLQSCSDSNTTYAYDKTGQVASETDPALNTTQYSYTDNPVGGNNPYGNSNAYLTQVTYPSVNGIQQQTNFSYSYSDGKLASSVDANSQSTSYVYSDLLRRLTEIDHPDGGSTTYNYHGDTLPLTVTETRLATPDPSVVTSTVYSGLGQVTQTRLDADPDGIVYTDSSYDGLGRLYTQSNPHRSGQSSTDGTTQYTYDSLGRTKTILRPDGNSVTYTYTGNCTTFTDEVLHAKNSCSDALGRITSVIEPNPSTGSLMSGAYYTYYGYDLLDNLTSVNQQGDGTLAARNRSYTYDSESRLLTAVNPESGTTTYTYDSASDCPTPNSFPGDLVKRVDNRGVRTCYRYDALHRLTNQNYSATTPATPAVTFVYDQTSYAGLATSYGVGRRVGMSDGTGSTAWSYTNTGEVATRQQTIAGVTNSIIHTYNLNHALSHLVTPNGHTYVYTYNGAGRQVSLVDNGTGATYAQNAHYLPPGELTSAVHGTNLAITESNLFNNRLQPTLLSATSPSIANIMSFGYGYDQGAGKNNGDIVQINNNRDTTRSTAYTYDYLDRLTSARTFNASTWGDAYVYDAFGNLLQMNVTQGSAQNLQVTVDANNHVSTSGFTYDAGGDLTWDQVNALNFDGERQANPATGYVYSYDGEGRRVEKNNSGTITYYWYDDNSNVISTTGHLVRDYVYFDGRRLAQLSMSNGSQYYYWLDQVGSTSTISDSSGSSVQWEADYYPFGKPNVLNNVLTGVFRFTSYEYDPELGDNYAVSREQSPILGRFFSADDGSDEDVINPQSWNLYSYVRNNPISNSDPSGHDCVVQTRTSETEETVSVSSGTCDNVHVGDGQTATYIAGVVDRASITSDNSGGITFGYTPYSGGGGVADLKAAPIPDNPGLAYGWGSNAAGYRMLGTAGAVLNDPRTYALWTGASAVGGGLVAWEFSATAASAELTNLGVGTGFDAFSNAALNRLISKVERDLLREYFKTKVLPKALSPRTLRIYAEIAKRVIAANNDEIGVQAIRLRLCEEALRKLAE